MQFNTLDEPMSVLAVPRGQSSQPDEPPRDEKVPAAHCWHTVNDVAPVASLNCPGEQAMHDAFDDAAWLRP